MWELLEYPGPCFDLHFDRFDGFIFEAEKPFENVCATGASPEACFRSTNLVGTGVTQSLTSGCEF